MKVLITGDRGYIGSTLAPLLIQNKYEVVGYDTVFFTKILGKQKTSRYTEITKDIRNIDEKDLDGIEAIIHLSALSNDPMGSIDPKLTQQINHDSSVRLAKMAKKIGVGRFLFSSSCSIYGIAKEDTVTEDSQVNPLTAYAKSKIDTENALQDLADADFCVGLLRNSTVYGYSPKFRDDLVVNNFVAHAVANKKIKVMSDGSPWRPLIDVRDLSQIFIEFLEVDKSFINGKIINIGFESNNLQVKQVLSCVEENVQGCTVIYTGEHGADTRSYKVSFKLFMSLFPHIRQDWNLEKSVQDLARHLIKAQFSSVELAHGDYTRLTVLRKLIQTGRVDQDLYWKSK